MATVLSPYLTVPKINRSVKEKICETRTQKMRPPLDYYRSKSASRIKSELLADAYCHIIADRCESHKNLRRSENVNYDMRFRSNVTPELREIQREINDSSFFQRTDAFNDLKSLEKIADRLLDDYRYVGGYSSSYRWRSRLV